MKRSVLAVAFLLMWCSHDVTYAFDPKRIKTEVSMSVLSSQWLSLSPGLTQWSDSRYYKTSLDTRFDFNRVLLFSPAFVLRYNRISLSFKYVTNSLPLETYSATYKTQLRQVDGTLIHPLRGSGVKEYRFAISYGVAKNADLFFEASLSKRRITGGYEGTIYEFNPLSGIQVMYKNNSLALGLDARGKLGMANFFMLGTLAISPYTKWTYTYQFTDRVSFRTRKMNGWSGYVRAGIGYQWQSLTLLFAYQPQLYRTYNRSLKDQFTNIHMGVAYSF